MWPSIIIGESTQFVGHLETVNNIWRKLKLKNIFTKGIFILEFCLNNTRWSFFIYSSPLPSTVPPSPPPYSLPLLPLTDHTSASILSSRWAVWRDACWWSRAAASPVRARWLSARSWWRWTRGTGRPPCAASTTAPRHSGHPAATWRVGTKAEATKRRMETRLTGQYEPARGGDFYCTGVCRSRGDLTGTWAW